MTDRHPSDSLAFGHPGRLHYSPLQDSQPGDCGWQTSRDHENVPLLAQLGPSQTWVPAHDSVGPLMPHEVSWRQSRRQRTWLLKNRPGAALGNSVVRDILAEALSSAEPDPISKPDCLPLDVGELTDASDAQRTSAAPMIAMVTGGANSTLRFVKLNMDTWQWQHDGSIGLRLADGAGCEETLWSHDAGVVRRIKCIVDTKRYDPTRWVIVQRDLGTRVFQPEFRNAPARFRPAVRDPGDWEYTRFAANPIFFLPTQETGCQHPSDVSFNPGVRSRPPQLAFIDEAGYWSVWDILRVRAKKSGIPKPKLRKRGHIGRGVLENFPVREADEPRSHRIFWVGAEDMISDESDDSDSDAGQSSRPQKTAPALRRSWALLFCNAKTIRILDVEASVFLPELGIIPENSNESIRDVHVDQDPRTIFVLTTTKLFVISLSNASGESYSKTKAQVLLTIPHLRDKFDQSLQLTVAQGPSAADMASTLILIYSSTSIWLDGYYVGRPKNDPGKVKIYHRPLVIENTYHDAESGAFQTLRVRPVLPVLSRAERPTDFARNINDRRLYFYELVALSSNGVVNCTLCTGALTNIGQITAPDVKFLPPGRQRLTERQTLLQYFSSRFVVPGYLDEESLEGGRITRKSKASSATPEFVPTLQRLLTLAYDELRSAFGDAVEGKEDLPSERDLSGTSVFEAIHKVLNKALEQEALPTTTLLQLVEHARPPDNVELASFEWENELSRLGYLDQRLDIRVLGGSGTSVNQQGGLTLASLYSELSTALLGGLETIPYHLLTEDQVGMLRQLTFELFLSLLGVFWRPSEPLGLSLSGLPAMASHSGTPDRALLDHDDDAHSTASTARVTNVSTPRSERSPSVATTVGASPEVDSSMALIRSWTGTGRTLAPKPTQLLSQWNQGDDPSQYVFRLEKDKEVTPGMIRTAKKLERAQRKRKRTETLLQMGREQEGLPLSQPTPETRFHTQPMQLVASSSQTQFRSSPPAVTMSQPVAGAFGQRELPSRAKKPKVKRKGGF